MQREWRKGKSFNLTYNLCFKILLKQWSLLWDQKDAQNWKLTYIYSILAVFMGHKPSLGSAREYEERKVSSPCAQQRKKVVLKNRGNAVEVCLHSSFYSLHCIPCIHYTYFIKNKMFHSKYYFIPSHNCRVVCVRGTKWRRERGGKRKE